MIRNTFFFLFVLYLFACNSDNCNCEDTELQAINPEEIAQIDISEIKEKGKLTALTTYSSTSYFIYRGQPMGYEYELLERLADYLEVDLELVVADDLDSMFFQLNNGEVDIIAHGLTITNERKKWVDFTEPHITTRQVLVQRMPKNWRQMSRMQMEDSLVRNLSQLIGKNVYVRNNTSYHKRLVNLSDEIGGSIKIQEVPGYLTTEELIKKVAYGEYDYTVADQNVANINKTYYPQLDINTPVSFPQQLAWAVRKGA
ncbi:MAG: transporter substrate-binding domain-containing protein, partial [Cyclobacteriaceae bacterium]